ncbi:MAG: hypothetical protein M1825_005802 [Sarcosagium campestre]|nr:MAG: hypothetical protein M1825_005802 [Sarcosagium campestre]
MHCPSTSLLAALSCLAASTLALPNPQSAFGGSGSDPVCVSKDTYEQSSASAPHYQANKLVAGQQCVANAGGCTISDGKTYSVSVSVSAGFSIDFGEVAKGIGGGLSADISVTTTKAQSITTGVTCSEGCTCGLMAAAQVITVEGTKKTDIKNEAGDDSDCVGSDTSSPYKVDLPVIAKSGAKENQAVVKYSGCRVGGTFCTADPTLPLCPEP